MPSATAQCLRYSLAGLQRVGHECLGKKLLGYNAKVDAEHIASGKYSLEEQFPDEIALMPDLTTFLCVLKKKELGAFITYVEVAYSMEDDLWNGKFEEGKLETSEPQRTKNGRIQEGVILRLKDAEHGIPIYRLPVRKDLTAKEVVELLDFSVERGSLMDSCVRFLFSLLRFSPSRLMFWLINLLSLGPLIPTRRTSDDLPH